MELSKFEPAPKVTAAISHTMYYHRRHEIRTFVREQLRIRSNSDLIALFGSAAIKAPISFTTSG